jgi:peptidoglycan hydrolase-like protein with peptidoglycan-binding domain
VQQQPTPQRYKEIQQALADRGYYKGAIDGNWGADSVEALKRFQDDQNLTATGKLDSLSLIALGLGPRRNLSARSESSGSSENSSRASDDNRPTEGSQRP